MGKKIKKIKALRHMTGKGIKSSVRMLAEPYYTWHKEGEEKVSTAAAFGPIYRNEVILAGSVATYSIMKGNPYLLETLLLTGGLLGPTVAMEGLFEALLLPEALKKVGSSIKNSWNNAKNYVENKSPEY
jgi:hypothetical protein